MTTNTQEKQGEAAKSLPCPSTVNILLLGLAIAACLIIFAGGVALAWGETAEVKMRFFSSATWACAVILAAAFVAMGFSIGKLFEGMVPSGMQPIVTGLIGKQLGLPVEAVKSLASHAKVVEETKTQIIPTETGEAKPIQRPVIIFHDNGMATAREALNDFEAEARYLNDRGEKINPPIPQPGEIQTTSAALSLPKPPTMPAICLALFAVLFLSGCAGTSATFKQGVKPPVDNIVTDMRDYTRNNDWDLNHNGAIEPGEARARADEESRTQALADAVADVSAIELETLDSVWLPVRSAWQGYVANDATMPTDDDKRMILDSGRKVDSLINLERQRQANIWRYLGLGTTEDDLQSAK